ncbi:hypothetical protein RF11_12047 [Thelohanellus kitauei]|uniref:Reverse transcriptase RNase H-like domain-containing protein n=1 Tax=Thelohanellus kitauei TaxID=669202 RepID=A0A0C2N4E5_THEKT|nr:hypothetical protein RF11_12047 [Thelohanellus kitauei]
MDKSLKLVTDASDEGIVAVLMQMDDHGSKSQLLAFPELFLKLNVTNAPWIKKHIAIVKLNLVTGHKPLERIFESEVGIPLTGSVRLVRCGRFSADKASK